MFSVSETPDDGLHFWGALSFQISNPWFLSHLYLNSLIQFWQVTWLEGDRNLAIITKTRFRFAESLARPAKGSLRSPFASGGLSRLRRSRSRFALDFPRASGARIWVNCLESSLWQRLLRNPSVQFPLYLKSTSYHLKIDNYTMITFVLANSYLTAPWIMHTTICLFKCSMVQKPFYHILSEDVSLYMDKFFLNKFPK